MRLLKREQEIQLGKSKYQYDKHLKELVKKKKQEAKRQRKLEKRKSEPKADLD